ncbi:MAG: protein kinase [Gemmataceae bacterium]
MAIVADAIKLTGPLTSYQYRKIRSNRIVDLIIGPYVVLEKIGEGGMGKVYKAVSQKTGKHVALKVVRSHLMSNQTVLRRYKREASAAAAMDHPNIVTLLDADEVTGRCYLAMEYVEGSDLSRLVKENGALPYQEAAEYIRQAALGLQHAHERGLIHRDIKPSNLLVSGERALPGTDGTAHVKILDMGLVRSIMGDDDVSRTELTRDGTVVGTPDYMAPEQAKNSSKVDAKADLYSLGATLFYLLRAQAPFPDGSPIDKLLRHQLDPPPDLKKLRPDLPVGLVAIVERLLKKKPEERYANAAELATLLLPYTPMADAGIVFTPAANDPSDAGVSLDLPSGSVAPVSPAASAPTGRKQLILDAEIVTSEKGSTPAPPKLAKTAAKPVRKVLPKQIVRPATSASSDPTSGSIPGSDVSTRQGATSATRTARPQNQRAAADRSPPRPIYRKPEPKSNRKMMGLILGTICGMVILIGALLLIWPSSNSKSTNKSNSTESKTTAPTKPATAPPSHTWVPAKPDLIVGDNAFAVLTIAPPQYWKRTIYEPVVPSRRSNWLKWLSHHNSFDTRNLERITISFLPRQETIAVGEGNANQSDWIEKLKSKYQIEEFASGWKSVSAISRREGNQSEKLVGLLLGDEMMAIGTNRQIMQQFGQRYSKNKSAEGLEKPLVENLAREDESTAPFVTFVAGKQWRLPDADRKPLMDYGISKLIATVRIVGEEFHFELTIWGDSEKRMKSEFLSLGLATHLVEMYPAIKPFQSAITTATPETTILGDQTKIHITGKWAISDFNDWLEKLLPAAPASPAASP